MTVKGMTTGGNRAGWLAWYLQAGVDEAIADSPVDRFALSAAKVESVPEKAESPPAPPPPPPPTPRPLIAGNALEATAREVADAAETLEDLAARFAAFEGVNLKATAKNFNPAMAMAGRITIAEVEELVPAGELDPNQIHTPGIFIQRIFEGAAFEKRIEQRTVREG